MLSSAGRKSRKEILDCKAVEKLFAVRPFVLLCVGSELRGDDGWTFSLVNKLQKYTSKETTFIWASTMPENFIKPISQIRPKRVIIADSADMAAIPGTVKILSEAEIADESYLSHRMPLKLTAQMLGERAGCEVFFILMQPENIEFEFGLTPNVKNSMEVLSKIIEKTLSSYERK